MGRNKGEGGRDVFRGITSKLASRTSRNFPPEYTSTVFFCDVTHKPRSYLPPCSMLNVQKYLQPHLVAHRKQSRCSTISLASAFNSQIT